MSDSSSPSCVLIDGFWYGTCFGILHAECCGNSVNEKVSLQRMSVVHFSQIHRQKSILPWVCRRGHCFSVGGGGDGGDCVCWWCEIVVVVVLCWCLLWYVLLRCVRVGGVGVHGILCVSIYEHCKGNVSPFTCEGNIPCTSYSRTFYDTQI